METAFTSLASLAGGVLIGSLAVLLMAPHGRIAGATVSSQALSRPTRRESAAGASRCSPGWWRAPLALRLGPGFAVEVPVPAAAIVGGGLVVGLGAELPNGCTSGHGVCGFARLSPRSAAAVVAFMATAGATVFVIRHVLGR